MNPIWQCVASSGIVLVASLAATASEGGKVRWHSNVQDAWNATRQQDRPLLIFVTREKCFYCDQMKQRTYSNAGVATAINRSFIPLVLDGGSNSPLLRELGITAVPATIVISPQAVIVDRIDGYVSPEVLTARLLAARPAQPVAKLAKEP